MEKLVEFTSANVALLVDDKLLNGVDNITINNWNSDGEPHVRIAIVRHVGVDEDLVEFMRTTPAFSFRMLNNSTSAGYVSEVTELENFTLYLNRMDDGKELALVQTIWLKSKSCVFLNDARSEKAKTTEAEDYKNLITILKTAQHKAVDEVEKVEDNKAIAVLKNGLEMLDEALAKKDKKKKKKDKKKNR